MPSVEHPEDSFQTIGVSDLWWDADETKELVRGKLVWAHVQFFDEIPLQLLPKRSDDRQHTSAILQAFPLRADQKRSEHETLPVAALESTSESILRFDQAFPLSHQPQSYVSTGYRLSPLALDAVDEWLDWYITGMLPEGELRGFSELMHEMDTEASG